VYLWQRPSPNHVRQTLANLKCVEVGEALDLVQLLGKAVLNAQNFGKHFFLLVILFVTKVFVVAVVNIPSQVIHII